MSSLPRIVVVGGHGKVALHFARLASRSFQVTSLVRSESHFKDIEQTGATPNLVSLEHASVDQLSAAFDGAYGVLFAAGAGGKGGPERTNDVDHLGAVKVFDAIERTPAKVKPKLVLVGALDTRDMSKPAPAHYTESDIRESKKTHDAIGAYYDAKLAAARDLHTRSSFPWIELRPGHLSDDEPTGHVSLGITHMGSVSRQDVAAVILALFEHTAATDQQQQQSLRLSLDLVAGETKVRDAVDQAIDKGESSYTD